MPITRWDHPCESKHLTFSVYDTRRKLSGGMQRKLSLMLSLLGHPDVLLLDEPTAGMDPSVRQSVWKVGAICMRETYRCDSIARHMHIIPLQ